MVAVQIYEQKDVRLEPTVGRSRGLLSLRRGLLQGQELFRAEGLVVDLGGCVDEILQVRPVGTSVPRYHSSSRQMIKWRDRLTE